MPSLSFSFCRFHLFRLLRAQPGVFAALAISSLAVAVTSLLYLQQWQRADAAGHELAALRASSQQAQTERQAENPLALAAMVFPSFQSARLVDAFNQLAAENKLPLDEVSYALDDSANQPYLRYRVTVTASATYPLIRHFVDQISATLPHVALDAISCTREDIGVIDLSCDLVFSAIFRKDGNG